MRDRYSVHIVKREYKMPVDDSKNVRCVDLKVDRSLLDSNFDGYKLSLDALPMYRVPLEIGVDVTTLTEAQYSYQHAKAFGSPNLLHWDPWQENTVYFVDSNWCLYMYTATLDGSIGKVLPAWQVPHSDAELSTNGRVAVTISFPAADRLLLANGAGHLYICNTGNRGAGSHDMQWQVEYSSAVLGDGVPFTVLHATTYTKESQQCLDCLLLHVAEVADEKQHTDMATQKEANGDESNSQKQHIPNSAEGFTSDDRCKTLTSQFTTILEWLSFTTDGKQWVLERTRRFHGGSSPDYAAIETGGSALLLSSEKPFTTVYDSMNPVEEKLAVDAELEAHPAYTWTQTSEDLTIQFTLPHGVKRPDIKFSLTASQLEVGLTDGTLLLHGKLCRCVDASASTWTLSENRLEVFLSKASGGPWPLVVEGDTSGQMVVDPEEAAAIHDRLAHLTSDTWNADPREGTKPAYNSQQLEECDMVSEADSTLVRIDGDTHVMSHKVHLGSRQWLLTMPADKGSPPALCLRHDVDGLLWQPCNDLSDDLAPWKHIATLKAFGYIQASKQQRKFCLCSPDLSYAVICDCVRHIYIYRQHTPVTTELRNRRTGHQVSSVCKQQMLSLDTSASILGARCNSQSLFLLVDKMLYIVTLATGE